jgi:hypothetical protein
MSGSTSSGGGSSIPGVSTVTSALGGNIGNSSISYGTLAIMVVVVVVTMVVFNLVLRGIGKVV